MKRTVRKRTFETNSSSVHTVVISKSIELEENLMSEDSETGKIMTEFGEFGWGLDFCTSQRDRLSYLVTMVAMTEGREVSSIEEFFNLDGFRYVSEKIEEYTGFSVGLDDNQFECYNYENEKYFEYKGYIDHQSCEYDNVKHFLSDIGISVVEFVFGKDVEIKISNDNDGYFEGWD